MSLEILSTFAHRYIVFYKITFPQVELRLAIQEQITYMIVYI